MATIATNKKNIMQVTFPSIITCPVCGTKNKTYAQNIRYRCAACKTFLNQPLKTREKLSHFESWKTLPSILGWVSLVSLFLLTDDFISKHDGAFMLLFLYYWIGYSLGAAIDRLREIRFNYARKKALCKHGVVGALFEYKNCSICQQIKIAEEQRAKSIAKEEEARKKAARKRAYREWVEKIRMPEYLQKMHPEEFEHLVCNLFHKMGYDVEHTPYTGDGGIDGRLTKNGELSLLQCKRVKGSVGRPVIQQLYGIIDHECAKEGVVVTTGKVSDQARAWAENKPIRIIERDELIKELRQHFNEDDIVPTNFIPNTQPMDVCPKCGSKLRVVKWNGKRFIGCSAYPSCRYSTSISPKRRIQASDYSSMT